MKKALPLILLFVSVTIFSMKAQLGKDGAKVVSAANTIINEFTTLTANATTGSTSITVANSALNANGRFAANLAANDLVMIIQMQGATIKNATDNTWGDVTSYNNCGLYEFREVLSVPNATTINFNCPLTNNYTASGRVQVVRIPRYTTLTVNSGGVLTTVAWNGTTGGIASAEVLGNVIVNTGGKIDVTGMGFRGGAIDTHAGTNVGITSYSSLTIADGGEKGEGIAGYQADYDAVGGRFCRGAGANGGGGANGHNSGGGGGANAGTLPWTGDGNPDLSTANWANAWNLEYAGFATSVSSGGGRGGYDFSRAMVNPLTVAPGNTSWQGDNRLNVGGRGGRALNYTTGRIFLGGGGGGGHSNDGWGTPGSNGGGIVYLTVYGAISGAGNITANGNNTVGMGGTTTPCVVGGPCNQAGCSGTSINNGVCTCSYCGSGGSNGIDGAGGAGGGGAILLNAVGGANGISTSVNGGKGGDQNTTATDGEAEGPGGGGGAGYIAITSGNASTSIKGGVNGTTNSPAFTTFLPNGATKGGDGQLGTITVLKGINYTICPNTSTTVGFTGTPPAGSTVTWTNISGTVLGTGLTYTTPNLSVTTVYLAKICPGATIVIDTVYMKSCGPTVTATGVTICSGTTGNISATATGGTGPYTYTWSPATGLSSTTGTPVTASITTTTTYTVTAKDNTGATATTTAVVTINPVPTVSVPPATICNGTSTTLTASGATTYAWSPATGLSSTTGTPVTANPTTTTTYTVTGALATGCTGITTVVVTVNPVPTISVPPATICNGTSATLTASGANTYTWTPNTGLSGTTGTSVTANPTTTSTYTVIGTSAAGCTNSTTVIVTVNPIPTVTVPPATICNGTSATLTASGANTYTWTPGTGLSGTTGTSVTANPTTTSTYTVTGTTAAGCTNTTTVVVTVNPNPTVSVPPATICNGTSTTLTASGATTYTWNPTTGLSSGTGTTVTANPSATTTYTVTGSFATGCTGTTTVIVTVNPIPVVTGSGATICQGQTTTLAVAGASTYTWSPATGLSATTGTTVNANPTSTTTYTVVGTAVNGCTGSTTVVVTVNPPCGPSVIATGITVCNGVCGTVTSTASGGVPPYTYTWNTGATTSNITDCPAVTTTYTVTVTDNSVPVGSATAIAVITVNPNPVVTVPPATICAGTTTTLTASGATTYTWSPATGLNTTSGATVNANPNTTTSYTVTGANPTGCTGTVEVIVTVNPIPVVTVPNASICPGGSTPLTASGATTYTWSPITGLSSGTGTTVTANPAITTTYTVIGTSAGCTASTTVTVTVGALVATVSTNKTICFGASTQLTAGGGPIYSWTPATGLDNPTIFNPIASPTVTTTYTVVVSDAVCSDDAVVVITVNPAITLNVAPVNVTCFGACNGQTIVIPSGGTSPYTYSWSGGCTSAACSNVCAGTYNLTATDAIGCTATGITTVTEPAALTMTVTGQTNVSCFGVCDGTASVSTKGGTTPYNYAWTPSGGATANATGLCAGTFTCTITDANNCSVKTPVTITQPTKVVVTSTGASICPNGSAPLTANATGGSGSIAFTWSPATGLNTTSGASVNASPATTTVYTITGTDTNGCMGTSSVTVIVNPAPVIIIPAASICEGTSTTLTASGATTYSWSPVTGLSSGSGTAVTANPIITTTYSITGTNTFGCTGSTTVIVTVNPAPVVSATNGNACPGDTSTLTASGALTYSWSPATGLSAVTGSTVIAKPINTTTYVITGTSANGCTATALATAAVHPKPKAAFITSPDQINVFDPTVYFNDQSTGGTITSWSWSLGDLKHSGSTMQNPVYTYPDTIACYDVQLIVTNQFGCVDSTTGPVCIKGIFTFFIPNTFTPNGDGTNDGFLPKGTGIDETDYDLWIFDRWGNLIWHTNTWGQAWDGRANNGVNVAQIDTYVWKVHVKELDSHAIHNYIGHVNIVK